MYYRNAQSALVVYDLTKPTSLVKAKHWVAELQRQASPGIVIALVGNKLDLTTEGSAVETMDSAIETDVARQANATNNGDVRKVETKEAQSYAEEEGLLFFETSAKDGTGVQEVFAAIANAIPETQLKGSRGSGATVAGNQNRDESRVSLAGGPSTARPKDGCAC